MKKIEITIPDGYEFDKDTMSIIPIKDDNIEYVDLGLTSGTLWAKTNVGADDEIDYGNYLTFDVAQKYNCPTKEQIDELINECVWVWIKMIKGDREVKGYQVMGKNDNFIFLPAAGPHGGYWSSLDSLSSNCAYHLYFYSDYVNCISSSRHYGQSVRQVKSKN